MTTDAWGIEDAYEDALGTLRRTSEQTRAGILRAMQVEPHGPPVEDARIEFVLPGRPSKLRGPGELTLENGTRLEIREQMPHDLPPGYHDFAPAAGGDAIRVVVSPGRCVLPPMARSWGWAAQLYAVRSSKSWGMGDLADLRRLGRWSAELGAGVLLVNPLHAVAPVLPQESSPYNPISRRFRNPLYIHIEEVPGFARMASELAELVQAGNQLNERRVINRDEIFRLKRVALGQLWRDFTHDAAFEAYCHQQGDSLRQFAIYCALAELFGKSWRQWESAYQQPSNAAVQRFAEENQDRVRYHQWLQWLLDGQLARAASEVPLVQDLPIGADPDGVDAWVWQGILAKGARIGAPPDVFNTQGQDWGLPPFIPHKLRMARYEPFIETIRATLRHAGGLRIDHGLGLFRLFWIPEGMGPREGAYVRYPADELLAILALESQRAGAFVVAEDLGTVESGMPEQLARHNVMSYRVLWFETDPPSQYPELALAAVTTHDLPTVAGQWSGADLKAQQALNLQPDETQIRALRERLKNVAHLHEGDSVAAAVEGAYRALAAAPSVLLSATLEDALCVEERPNMPSTTTQWPNWSLALPASLETLQEAPLARSIADALARPQTQRTRRQSANVAAEG